VTQTFSPHIPFGQYKLDEFAYLYARGINRKSFEKLSAADKAPYVKLLRGEVSRLAKIAAARAQIDKKDNLISRKLAQQLIKALAKIDKLTTWLPPDNASLIAADLSRVLKPLPPERSVVPAVCSIIDSIRLVRAWHAQGFELVPPLPNNIDLLGRHFVEVMVEFHEHYTHKKPPASRSSDFARLLAAIWTDLEFQVPGGGKEPEDLVVYLGAKIERVISRSRKIKTRPNCGM
jgi:hypothetical protein